MVTLYCDHGDTRDVRCGLSEPLMFEDGYAEVEDSAAADGIVARHVHIHDARKHPDANLDGADESETAGETDTDDTDDTGTETEFTCVGNDGACSRTVETEDGRCWQHLDNNDDDEGGGDG